MVSSLSGGGRRAIPQGHAGFSVVQEFVYDAEEYAFDLDDPWAEEMDEEFEFEESSFGLEGFVTTGAETISSLAFRYSIDPEALAVLNGKSPEEKLPAGTRVNLYRGDVALYSAEAGESLETIARRFGTDALLLSVCNAAAPEVMEGGERLFVPQGILESAGDAGEERASEVIIARPGMAARSPSQKPAVSFGEVLNFSDRYVWPLQGRITSGYGWRHHPILNRQRLHQGIDISARPGASIRSAGAGRVIYSGWRGASGRTVIIEHHDGLQSLYGHCSKLLVGAGEKVERGQVVARAGSSGRATGTHLHFAMKKGKKSVNPLQYLR